ncbi:S-adenosyl-L-homocysteine hydrolase [Mariprofundus sp. KV]|uniref:S-adenosyl-L-homocysteine hydrolase n=1 Tax=Mariprofundus sp. KV TaxID=2608715 RepID=UPI00159FF150|nr:S-adenosyl-L-homocysteine hydrolase [Mariprofundus sp. KV]NWF35363.1 S-adenosyl-L-homocysteine hydrolase [Mariprofundus sp. KV]
MLRTVLLAALFTLFSGCASDGTQVSDADIQNDNQRLKAEAAALRNEINQQKAELEALKAK